MAMQICQTQRASLLLMTFQRSANNRKASDCTTDALLICTWLSRKSSWTQRRNGCRTWRGIIVRNRITTESQMMSSLVSSKNLRIKLRITSGAQSRPKMKWMSGLFSKRGWNWKSTKLCRKWWIKELPSQKQSWVMKLLLHPKSRRKLDSRGRLKFWLSEISFFTELCQWLSIN